MAGELVSFRYVVDGRTCLDWYVLNVGDEQVVFLNRWRVGVRRPLRRSALHNFVLRFLESLERKRTRLSGRSAASWERTAEELLSRWAALLIAARQHNSWAICDFGVEDRGTSPAPNRSTTTFVVRHFSPLSILYLNELWEKQLIVRLMWALTCSLPTWPFPTAATAVAALRTWWMRKSQEDGTSEYTKVRCLQRTRMSCTDPWACPRCCSGRQAHEEVITRNAREDLSPHVCSFLHLCWIRTGQVWGLWKLYLASSRLFIALRSCLESSSAVFTRQSKKTKKNKKENKEGFEVTMSAEIITFKKLGLFSR